MEIKRRDFLKLFGSLSGAVVLGEYALDEVMELPEGIIELAKNGPGVETWQNTICGLCPAGCGMRIRLIDGIPVYVKGNPIYPINKGGLCPLGLNALHSLYHPDRLKRPMRKNQSAGTSGWEDVSWDEALKTVSDKLVELRNTGKPHHVAFLGHEENGLMKRLIERFMQAYGSPNYYQCSSAQNNVVPYALLHGHTTMPTYDILNARLIVSFGSNFLEEGYSPIYYTKLYSHHEEQRTRYVQIESRLSLTAANADQWVPILPGTYGALALGLAYVLIREELYDKEFVQQRMVGFEDRVDRSGTRHVGFKNMVLGNYYPEKVEELTGVPSSVILQLGREIGNTRPSLVIGDHGAIDNTNGTYSAMAVHSLNALLGNFEKEGGIFFVDEPPFGGFKSVPLDATARKGRSQDPIGLSKGNAFPLTRFSIESFTKNVLSGTPYPIDVLFVLGGNPLFSALNQKEFSQALQKIPLVVSFDNMLNETSEHAHVILPHDHFMESWGEVSNVTSVGFTHVGMQHPVISRVYDTRHTGDVLIDLAKRIGGQVSRAFPLKNYEEELKRALNGVYNSGTGAIVTEGVGTHWIQFLRQRGWQIGQYASFDEFWDRLIKQGGWWNPIRKTKRWGQVFRTRSQKFELSSQALREGLDKLVVKTGKTNSAQDREFVLSQLNISARGDTVFLPHHEPVPYEVDMPLHLITFRVLSVRDGQGAALPMMQEMFGHSVRRYWQSWAEINPKTAELQHVRDGDWILVQSDAGNLKVKAKVSEGIMPNVIAIPFGLGHTSLGRYAKGHGVNPNSIMKNLYDMLSGKPATQATKVRISVAT
ncbi:MAG: molybdopterin-dependent oxidoreductase [Ignavibacteriales bacterium]|nr:molybdopterin-dependent oxidoreductase [Ignavibacteriales bacterium]